MFDDENFNFLDLEHNTELIVLQEPQTQDEQSQSPLNSSQIKNLFSKNPISQYSKKLNLTAQKGPELSQAYMQKLNIGSKEAKDKLTNSLFTGNKSPETKKIHKKNPKNTAEMMMIGVSGRAKAKTVGRKIRNLALENYVLNFIKETILTTSK